jgi:phospholipid/cholesterol/gamma-HCH transport system substrate-binding protein
MSAGTGVRTGRTARLAASVVAGSVLLTGCQGLYDVQLPGGAATGDDVYRVVVEFRDVLDLVPQSAVKANDVTVGAVEDIWLDGWTARVRIRVEDSVELPDNAVAELRQTSLLGEKFVSLEVPEGTTAQGRLSDGDVIPLSRSGRNPEVEEVFSALSLVLNGGGVAQLRTINRELTQVMQGRETEIKSVIDQLDVFIGGLDDRKSEIVRALEGLDRLSATLARQKRDLAVALDDIPQGLEVLADQRRRLTEMLQALSELGEVGTRVIEASQEDFVANLESLAPILTRLSQAGSDLPRALEVMFTYPFPRSSLGAIRGDFTNLRADIDEPSLDAFLTGLPEPPAEGEGSGTPELPLDPRAPLPAFPEWVLPDVCATDVPLPADDRLPECRLPGGDVADPGLLDLMLGGLVR